MFADRGDSLPLVLGSVKTNLGHLEAAAGVAGFIKTVLSLRNGYIPRHLNFETLTPHATEAASCLTIASDGREWPSTGRPRRAGVSSFGVSGTNAHMVLEQAPELVAAEAVTPPPVSTLVVVPARPPDRVTSLAAVLADWMTGPGAQVPLADIAHTLNHHRTRHPRFATVCARDQRSAVAGLRALTAGEPAIGLCPYTTGSAVRARCLSIPVRARSGRGWAGDCSPRSRRSPPPSPSWSRTSLRRRGFRCSEVLAGGEAVTGIDAHSAGAGRCSAGADRAVAFVRGASRMR